MSKLILDVKINIGGTLPPPSYFQPRPGSRFWTTVRQQNPEMVRVKLIFGSRVKICPWSAHAHNYNYAARGGVCGRGLVYPILLGGSVCGCGQI